MVYVKGCEEMNSKYKADFATIGKRIYDVRKEQGLTQVAMARRLGTTAKHMSEIERGISGVALGTLVEIAQILDVSTDYLLMGKEPENGPSQRLLSTLTPRQRFFAEQLLSTFAACCKEYNEDL